MIYDVYDNVLEPHVAELIDSQVRQCEWHWSASSNIYHFPTKHWVLPIGQSKEEIIRKGYEWVLPIWEAAAVKYNFREKYTVEDFSRVYMNGHTYGMTPHRHKDDGSFTMIYYPNLNWKIEWDGGTIIYGEEEDHDRDRDKRHGLLPTKIENVAEYKGNRLVVFDAWRWHSAQAVRRECYELRAIIVFKTYANRERLDFYKNVK